MAATTSGRSDLWTSIPTIRVLDEDAELLESVDEVRRAVATRASIARVIHHPPGRWRSEPARGGFGLLVLDGLLLRRAGWGDRFSAELLGPGDLIQPWEEPALLTDSLQLRADWSVLTEARLAVLDAPWAARMSPWPGVATALTRRALARSRHTAELMAIAQVRRLELRVWLLLWCLAERYGRVHRDGVHVELPLTHSQLAELASSRRPSLSAAVARLARAGHVQRRGHTWMLTAPAPGGSPSEDVSTVV